MHAAIKTLVFSGEREYGFAMKITLKQISEGNEEVIIRYRQMRQEISDMVKYLEGQGERLLAERDGQQVVVLVSDILYLESVDGAVFLYTDNEVCRAGLTLTLFESLYVEEGFFRCSKSMVLNIYRISRLKSMPGSRIDVTMDNGEHITISRRYAKELRRILKGEE